MAHSLGITDFYCSLAPHGVLQEWDKFGELYGDLKYDAYLKLFGAPFILEHERGSNKILPRGKTYADKTWTDSFNYKVDRYLNYCSHHADAPHMLITLEDFDNNGYYDARGTNSYLDQMVEFLSAFKQADRFLVAKHRDCCGDRDGVENEIHNEDLGSVTGQVWVCPADPDTDVSIQEFLASKHT